MNIFFFLFLDLLSLDQTYGSLRNFVHCHSSVFLYRSSNGPNTVLTPWRWRPFWSLLISYRISSLFEVIYPLVNSTARWRIITVLSLHSTNNFHRFNIFRKQESNHSPHFFFGANRQWSFRF
jgi:hypothetical protein